jgi:hypothetical protein
MAETMQLWAAMGHPCGNDFIAASFLKEHPEYRWMKGPLDRYEIATLDGFYQQYEEIKKPPGGLRTPGGK